MEYSGFVVLYYIKNDIKFMPRGFFYFFITRTCLERRSQSEIININDLNSLTHEPSSLCAILIRLHYRLLLCSVSKCI